MKIGIGIIAYNVSTELDWLLKSIADSSHSDLQIMVYLHQHSTQEKEPEVTAVCERWALDDSYSDFFVSYTYHGINHGLSASWNDALERGYQTDECDVVLLVNDDITFLPGALKKFATYAVSRRDAYMVTTLGYHHYYAQKTDLGQQPLWGFGFSCFAVNPVAVKTIGYFDTNIFPIYFEDCDYGRRGYLAGLQMAECKDAGIIHWGSLSAQGDGQAEMLAVKSPLNAAYYTRKWGGLPGSGKDVYPTPFNDPNLDLEYDGGNPLYDRWDVPRLVNGCPWPSGEAVQFMPDGYVQPPTRTYPFRAGSGGNSIWSHMERLADFAKFCSRPLVEVGSGCGDGSTHAFDLGRQKAHESTQHISVNLHPVGGGWEPINGQWKFIQGDSREISTVEAVKELLEDTPGIIYIDTEHTYATLKRELEIWLQIADEDTLYLFHDVVGFPEMTVALLEAVAPGGSLHDTHYYLLIEETCSGLGALVPRKGWQP